MFKLFMIIKECNWMNFNCSIQTPAFTWIKRQWCQREDRVISQNASQYQATSDQDEQCPYRVWASGIYSHYRKDGAWTIFISSEGEREGQIGRDKNGDQWTCGRGSVRRHSLHLLRRIWCVCVTPGECPLQWCGGTLSVL